MCHHVDTHERSPPPSGSEGPLKVRFLTPQPHVRQPGFLNSYTPSSLQASSQVDDPLAPGHLEFKFEPEDFPLPAMALGSQAGLGGALRQEAWCALALA